MEAEVSDNLEADDPRAARETIDRSTRDRAGRLSSSNCRSASVFKRLIALNLFRADSVQVLILCEWPRTTFDPQEVLRGFTSLRKLMIANSNLTRLSTAFPVELEFLEVEDTCQAAD